VTTTVEGVVAKTALFGLAGWAGETLTSDKPHYSAVFAGRQVPFLPIYAAGGLAAIAAAPHLEGRSVITRALVYAALGTAIEYAGCQIDRRVFNARSWDYGTVDGLAGVTEGCLSWKHTALWAGLGLLAEKLA
jgi:uncharacterized membrane protein